MNKIRAALTAIVIAMTIFQIGCKSSTQVTNNTTNSTGPWAGATTNAQFPLVLGDSTGGTLTAVLDTDGRSITGAIFSNGDSNEVIFIGDSGLPTRVIVGTKEIILANYTDSSVDVVATDTAGSIGVQPVVNIENLLLNDTIRSNKISRVYMKAAVPTSYTIQDFIDIGEKIGTAKDITDCILPIIANLSVLTAPLTGPEVPIALSKWFTPPDFEACQSLFKTIMETLENSGAFKSQPPAPPRSIPSLFAPGAVWGAAAFLDSTIYNKPTSWFAAISATQDGGTCVESKTITGNGTSSIASPSNFIDPRGSFGFSWGESNNPCVGGGKGGIFSTGSGFPIPMTIVSTDNILYGSFSANEPVGIGYYGSVNGNNWSSTSTIQATFRIK